jgi:hypothetical protein
MLPIMIRRASMLVTAVALLCMPAISIAANDDPKELERVLAKTRSDPMIFIAAAGEPNACGRGCTKWIAAEGTFDEGAAQRFREFLTGLENRNLPIFFNSDGGLVGQAVQIGVILRENRMSAGVARTVPEGCNLGSPPTEACRRLMGSKREHKARLYFGAARCASACVYAMVGASTRHVDPAANVRIHSGLGQEIDKAENFLRRYVVTMGVDPALVDAAKIPFRSFRGLSRGEMEQFGFETRGAHETPWFAYHGPPEEFLLLKSVTLATGDADEFRTRTVGLACGPLHPRIRFMYRQELTSKESRFPPMLRAKIGDSVIDFTIDPNKDSVEKSFDIQPRELHSAIASERFEVVETLDRATVKKAPLVVKFTTSGIWAEIAALEKCASKNNVDASSKN